MLILKKVFISLLLFSISIFASDINQTYSDAVAAYKKKDFQRSYEILSKIYLTKLSDAKLSFYLGRSAYETGHYEIALAAFERVDMLNPTNLRNKLEKARTYFMLHMYEDAQTTFQEVLDNPTIPKNVRDNIQLYLAKIKGVQQKSFTYATINLDWLYDSNVNYAPVDDTYNIGSTSYPSPSRKSDKALQTSMNVANIYDIGDANGFALKNSALVYLKRYSHQNKYDISYLAYTPSIFYKDAKFSAEFILGLDTMNLDKKSYLKTIYYIPKFTYAHTHTLSSITYFKYQKKFFQQQKQSNLNANHYEFSYGLQAILTPRSYIQSNIIGIRESKQKGTRIDVNYDTYKINTIYKNQFSPTYSAEFYGELKQKKYDDFYPAFNSTRKDLGKTVSASLSTRILKTLHLNTKVSYSKVNSNQSVFSYQKYTFTLGLTKTF